MAKNLFAISRSRKNRSRHESYFPWLVLLPAVAVIWILDWIPPTITFSYSLMKYVLSAPHDIRFVGLQNYITLLSGKGSYGKALLEVLSRSTYVAISSTILGILLSLVFALALNERFRGRGPFRTILLVPWVIPPVVSAAMWRWIFNPSVGPFASLDMPISRALNYPFSALSTVVLVQVWTYVPFMTLVILSGLQTIPEDLYEAASIDGATMWQRFSHITLPMLGSSILIASAMSVMISWDIFDIIYVLTYGGPGESTRTAMFYVYHVAFGLLDFGNGAAIMFVSMVIPIIFGVLAVKIMEQRRK